MKLWQSIKNLFAPPPAGPQARSHTASDTELDAGPQPEPEDAPVPELEPAQVQKALAGALPPLLLDVREGHEWKEVRIPAALHIPMNSVPDGWTNCRAAAPLWSSARTVRVPTGWRTTCASRGLTPAACKGASHAGASRAARSVWDSVAFTHIYPTLSHILSHIPSCICVS